MFIKRQPKQGDSREEIMKYVCEALMRLDIVNWEVSKAMHSMTSESLLLLITKGAYQFRKEAIAVSRGQAATYLVEMP